MEQNTTAETLLVKFFKEKLGSYQEPERQGTPKGDPIGFLNPKYKSILLSLTSLSLEDIARLAGKSYGLLRVWRTEQRYKKALEAHTREFAGLFAKSLLSIMRERRVVGQERKDDYALAMYPSDYFSFRDITIFSQNLMEAVYDEVRVIEKHLESWQQKKAYLSMAGEAFSIRKGYITYSPNGLREVKMDSPIVRHDAYNITFFDFVDTFERPWQPDREIAERDKNLFVEAIRGVL